MNIELDFKLSHKSGVQSVTAKSGQTVLEALRQNAAAAPPAPCGGRGRCGQCRVILEEPGVSGMPKFHEDEMKTLSEDDRNNGIRLSCRLSVDQGMHVRVEDSGPLRIETRAEGYDGELDPILRKRVVILPAGTLEDQRPSSARLEDELGLKRGVLPYSLIKQLPSIPDGVSPVTVIMNEDAPVALDVGSDTGNTLWAAAVDIGTTTVAMYLVNLVDGEMVKSKAELNGQAPFGADVISRLEHARKGIDEAVQLQRIIVDQLSRMLLSLAVDTGIDNSDIHILSVAGNTAMIHLLTGWDARGLGEAPFLPTALESPVFDAQQIGFTGFSRLKIWLLPSLSAYVGADITGGLVAAGLRHKEGIDLLLDIGTNGEMAIGGSGGLVCCSTAAGPAFEGAHLSSGIGSIAGAVDHVDWIDACLTYSTIDGIPPVGFCGSGVVDMVAFLVNSGLMDETGRIAEEPPEDKAKNFGDLEFSVGDTGTEIAWPAPGPGFTQKDLREVQLAKGAIRAGIETLMKHADVSVDEIDTLWLAGGFGNYIRPESAAAIGLIPRELAGKARSLGNAAARGAILCLLSKSFRDDSMIIAREAVAIELSGRPEFQNAYIEAMMFPSSEEN